MENTNDKSFERNNSDKPYIRTMEDDLKKIKNIPLGKDGAASAASSFAPASHQPNAPYKEIKRPTPFQPSAPVPTPPRTSTPFPVPSSAPMPSPKPISTPAFSAPSNLPINNSAVRKNEPEKAIKKEVPGFAEKPRDIVDSSVPDSHVFAGLSLSKEKLFSPKKSPLAGPAVAGEKALPVSKPVAPAFKPAIPVSSSSFLGRKQSAGKLDEETEKLTPEARLARQSSLEISDNEIVPKEGLVASPISRTSPAFFTEPSAPVKPSNLSFLESSPSENTRRSIEEIIKEDNSNSFLKKFIKVMFVVLVIAGVGAGVFYFYISKNPIANPPVVTSPAPVFISGATEIVITAESNIEFNDQILRYFATPRPSGIYNVILKDKEGKNYLPLENFGNNLNIVMPDYVASALEKDYNLIAFNYPEKNYLRLGLVFKTKSLVDISAIAKKWESGMYKNVKPIFFNDFGTFTEGKQFGSNKYNNFDIRYLPLGFDNIGLNYAIDDGKKYLLIASSKQDIFSLIDKIIK